MPEGQEDNCLDSEELEDWFKWAQELHGGKVEEEERVECQADGEVVDDGDIEVSTVNTGGRQNESAQLLKPSLEVTLATRQELKRAGL